MSENELVLSEEPNFAGEEVIETPAEEIQTQEAADETATPSKEELAKEWLKEQGLDPDSFDPKKVAKLTDWERNLNKKSSELGAIAKQLETAPKPEKADEPDFDPEELKTLTLAMQKVLGTDPAEIAAFVANQKKTIEARMSKVADDFFAAHKDVEVDDIVANMSDPSRIADPEALERELTRAYKLVKADTLDIEAQVKAEVEKRLAALKDDGEQVVDVVKGRASAAGAHKTLEDALNDPTIDPIRRMEIAISGIKEE